MLGTRSSFELTDGYPRVGHSAGGLGHSTSFGGGALRIAPAAFSPLGQMPDRAASHDLHQGSAPGLLGRSTSNVVTPTFQFKFEPGLPSVASTGSSDVNRLLPPAHNKEMPPMMEAAPAASVVSNPPARGRDGVMKRLNKQTPGMYQEPIGCTLQLDECVAACRREVQAIAMEQRKHGQKFSDPDFPPDARALYTNGQTPSDANAHSSPDDWIAPWRRASDGAFRATGSTMDPSSAPPFWRGGNVDTLSLGPFGSAALLGALAAMRTAGKEPSELVVWREREAGVYGVRFFKDGEWMYEILDDFLPWDKAGRPACSHATTDVEAQDWLALVEKAYAKVHGSYEAAAMSSDAEALEDVLGTGVSRIDMVEFPIWGELWQHLNSNRRRGHVQLAIRRRERQGEALNNGLISCYGYALTRLQLVDGEMLCELDNPWSIGGWNGRWSDRSAEYLRCSHQLEPTPSSCRPFWMSIQDFCKHFTDVFEIRVVSPYWQVASVVCTADRPSYPLISVSTAMQAVLVLSQEDRRWSRAPTYSCAIGLRIYRCRVVAPPPNAVGVRQNVSSPFRNLELLAVRPPTKAHSVVAEVARLEPNCLYIVAMDLESRSPSAMLRVMTASAPRLRELSAPESSYFLQAQEKATPVIDADSFSSQGSADHQVNRELNATPKNAWRNFPNDGVPDYQGFIDGGGGARRQDGSQVPVSRMLQACMATCGGPLHC